MTLLNEKTKYILNKAWNPFNQPAYNNTEYHKPKLLVSSILLLVNRSKGTLIIHHTPMGKKYMYKYSYISFIIKG